MIAEILRLFPAAGKGNAAYLSFSGAPADLIAELDEKHRDAAAVVGINLHIEVQWEFSLALLSWCRDRGIPAWIYVHDYWPHHHDRIAAILARGAKLLASTAFLRDSLAADGYAADIIAVGVPLPDAAPSIPPHPWQTTPLVFASAGRLAPRKRFADIARAFREAALGDTAALYLRLLPSHVFAGGDDAEQHRLIVSEIPEEDLRTGRIRLDREPSVGAFSYAPYFAYVCASSYEGFSMSPIEAAYAGCPPLLSDIPAHRVIADTLFGVRAADFLYPMGDTAALGRLMSDEAATERRRELLAAGSAEIRAAIASRWSLANTVRCLAVLGRDDRPGSGQPVRPDNGSLLEVKAK